LRIRRRFCKIRAVTRWLAFAGVGVLIGGATFAFLLRSDIAVGPLFLAAGGVAAVVEGIARPSPAASARRLLGRRPTRAVLAFVLVSGAAMVAYALLFVGLVAP
jgi:hypothetical protein